MGQRIYRIDPPDRAGEVYEAEDAARLVGAGIYSRQPPGRPAGASRSRGRGSAERNRADKPAGAEG